MQEKHLSFTQKLNCRPLPICNTTMTTSSLFILICLIANKCIRGGERGKGFMAGSPRNVTIA